MKNTLMVLLLLLASTVFVSAQQRETRNVGDFTKISFSISGNLYLTQGSPQKVELEGDADFLKEVQTEVSGSRLKIGREGKWGRWTSDDRKVNVYITVPDIEAVSASGSGHIIGQSEIRTKDLDLNVSGSGSLTLEFEAKGEVGADVSGSGDLRAKGSCAQLMSHVSGSGKVMVDAAVAGEATFDISGSGRIQASGSADAVEARISGSGKVMAADLQANRCEVRISGSGDVEINVLKELDASISGSGSVGYKGNPARISSQASGSGKVRKL